MNWHALRSNQAEKAKRVFEEKISPRFAEYQRAFDNAVKIIHDAHDATSQGGSDAALFWMRVMLVVSAVSVVAGGLLGWLTTRSITNSTGKLLGRVHEMASGAGDLTARVEIGGRDELAQLATGSTR